MDRTKIYFRSVPYFVVLVFLIFTTPVHALNYKSGETGIDISWPNCRSNIPSTTFGIVGVTGGLNFHSNPCIGYESINFSRSLSLYVNTGYPGLAYAYRFSGYPKQCEIKDNYCLAYNYGYNAARYASDYAYKNGVISQNWWLDVEIVNSWDVNTKVNVENLKGYIDGLEQFQKPNFIGFYTYPPEWQIITGGWKNKFPVWVATDSNFREDAIKACKSNGFTGGNVILTQYITNFDTDLVC